MINKTGWNNMLGIEACVSKGTFNVVTQRIHQELIRSSHRVKNNRRKCSHTSTICSTIKYSTGLISCFRLKELVFKTKHSLASSCQPWKARHGKGTTWLQRTGTPDKGREVIDLHAILVSSVSGIRDIKLRQCNVF